MRHIAENIIVHPLPYLRRSVAQIVLISHGVVILVKLKADFDRKRHIVPSRLTARAYESCKIFILHVFTFFLIIIQNSVII